HFHGDNARARDYLEQSLAVAREHDLPSVMQIFVLGRFLYDRGDYRSAQEKLEEAAEIDRGAGVQGGWAALWAASAATHLGEFDRAREWFKECIQGYSAIGHGALLTDALGRLAGLLTLEGKAEGAACLLGFLEAMHASTGAS